MDRPLFTKDLLVNFPGIGTIRRIAKPLNWLGWGALIFVFAINFFDEDLRPEVAAYLNPEKPNVPDESNAYYAVAGLAAPAQDDAHAAGRRLVAQLEAAEARKLKGEDVVWPQAFSANLMLPDRRSVRAICNPARASCIDWASQNRALAAQTVASNEALLARYRTLHDYPAYAEMRIARFSEEPVVGAASLAQAQRVFFVQTALQVQHGDVNGALAELRKDIAFGRKGLAGARNSGTKAHMNVQLANSVLMVSEVLAHRRAEIGPGASALDDVLRPLQDDERRLAEALRGDFAWYATLFERMSQEEDWDKRSFGYVVKRNATINRSFIAYKVRSDADALTAAQFLAKTAAVRAAMPSLDWTYFYNPFGKTVADLLTADVAEDYQYQMYDLDALLRLVALQARLVAQRANDNDVQRLVASADARYHNPYTNAPMTWDAKAGQLCFEPQSARYGSPKKPPCCLGPLTGKAGLMCVRLSPPGA